MSLQYNAFQSKAHSHQISAVTDESKGHRHRIEIFSFPVDGSSVDRHVHQYQGVTFFHERHRHRFYGTTGPAIPLADGTHYHTVSGTVYRNYEDPYIFSLGGVQYIEGVQYSPVPKETHNHMYGGSSGKPLGYFPSNW